MNLNCNSSRQFMSIYHILARRFQIFNFKKDFMLLLLIAIIDLYFLRKLSILSYLDHTVRQV